MLVTEAEAKNLACHRSFAQTDGGQAMSWGCIGSRCMAWRWREKRTDKPELSRGYCGLAGDAERAS